MRWAKIVTDDNIIEYMNTFQHFGSNTSMYKMNMEFEENVQKYNTLNDVLNYILGRICRRT
jgi:hypothetical protein